MLYYDHVEQKKETARLQGIADEQRATKEAEEEIIEQRYEEVTSVISTYLPGIICWGDSLTAGAGGNGTTYPGTLQKLLQINITESLALDSLRSYYGSLNNFDLDPVAVVNMGVGGEDTTTILGRNGAIPFVVADDFIIPADNTPVEITMVSSNGKNVAPLRQGAAGLDYVVIDGVRGTLSIEKSDASQTYYFTRATNGETVEIKAGTEIVTSGAVENLNYIPVIFIGQNGGYDDIEDLIAQQKAIIEHQKENPVNEDGSARFIIVGLHTGTEKSRAVLETAMEVEYGDQYINLREYMSTEGLADAGIEATEEDQEMMADGMTPASLLSDSVHFTADAYWLIGNQIYERMNELGYFDEVKEVIDAAMVPLE